MKYKLVIFDFDGTLADSFPWFLRATNKAADKFIFKRLDLDQLDTLRGYGARQLITHLGLPLWKLPLVARYMRKRMTANLSDISLFDGVDRTLTGLASQGVATALLTSNSLENVRPILMERTFFTPHLCRVRCITFWEKDKVWLAPQKERRETARGFSRR
jgi:phosphoglycolate phosphatase